MATRTKPRYRYPKNAAVEAGSARLSAANAAWTAMSVEAAERWNVYAESLPPKRGFDGTLYATTGKNVLVAYVAKILQIDPSAAIPLDPPTRRFVAPEAEIEMTATDGALRFTSSLAVPAGVLVEIMVQALPNGKRKPVAFYKSARFASFPEAGSSVDILVRAGWYASAAQFVEASTGRVAGHRLLRKVEIKPSSCA